MVLNEQRQERAREDSRVTAGAAPLDSPPKCWEQNGSGYDKDEGKHLLVHQQ